jgi:1-pyrroline-5-carboxylate dehydrogenase
MLGRISGLYRPLGMGPHGRGRAGGDRGIVDGQPDRLHHFLGAVIDERAFVKHSVAIDRARAIKGLDVVAGGQTDDEASWFVRPTIVLATDPMDEIFHKEYFGPILAVYDDDRFEQVALQAEAATPYAVTGAVIARDRKTIAWATEALRAAGNFYINDKPAGAVVGQQPFGGGRASGPNDKAGSAPNLLRWTSPGSLKDNLLPPTDHRYPHMDRAARVNNARLASDPTHQGEALRRTLRRSPIAKQTPDRGVE